MLTYNGFFAPLFVGILTLSLGGSLTAQRRVDERNYGERITLIAPLQGSGTPRDPYRPLFAPSPEELRAGASAILSYTAVLSDDKKFALIEFVARDQKAFEAILKDTRPDVKKFDHSRGAKKAEIELEFKKYKKDFSYDKFKEGK
jgi:hypothetical protein